MPELTLSEVTLKFRTVAMFVIAHLHTQINLYRIKSKS
jgi:hypothetical protein